MTSEGPPLEQITRRLAECPADFLDEPRIGDSGRVHVAAVVSDVLRDCAGAGLSPAEAAGFGSNDAKRDRNRLMVVLVGSWLLADPWFRTHMVSRDQALALFVEGARELAASVQAGRFVTDGDRREELARFSLARLGLRPRGESEEQAQDRLTTISSAERARVILASRRAEERARKIREELATQRANESADKYTRE